MRGPRQGGFSSGTRPSAAARVRGCGPGGDGRTRALPGFLPAGPPSSLAPGSLVSLLGEDLAGQLETAPGFPLPTELGGLSVSVSGRRAPLVAVSRSQVNAILPDDLELGALHTEAMSPHSNPARAGW
ncbi:MAG: hypothetical protein FJW20_04330 [Acidimicrobiia bacterium]|nr:hypothetical protein [Acidimicrobiia bacterium]